MILWQWVRPIVCDPAAMDTPQCPECMNLWQWVTPVSIERMGSIDPRYEKSQNTVIRVTDSLTQQMKQLLRMPMEEGIRTVRRVFTSW